ncbi:MAG: adenosylcobinamide-GDP ribazoletransferase [Xanthobacteraceae bacterium]
MTINDVWLTDRAHDLKASILFLTRLPFARATPVSGAAIAQAAWAFPIAGVLVGLIGALVYALAHRAGLPAWPAAALTLAATMAVTGCLHEDGLADTADGFGGGKTREQKLEIMRDSGTRTYGACALALSILLRVGALASLADPALVAAALIAAHGASRAILPVFMYFVPPARSDGLSFTVGRPPRESVAGAAVLGVLIVALCLGPALGIAALVLLLVVIALMAWLSLAQIDGQTGDILGAVEQVSEVAILLVALR